MIDGSGGEVEKDKKPNQLNTNNNNNKETNQSTTKVKKLNK